MREDVLVHVRCDCNFLGSYCFEEVYIYFVSWWIYVEGKGEVFLCGWVQVFCEVGGSNTQYIVLFY